MLGSQPAPPPRRPRHATGIHGPISRRGRQEPRLCGVRHRSERRHPDSRPAELLTPSKNPLEPTTEEMLAPQVGFVVMSPTRVRTRRSRCMACLFQIPGLHRGRIAEEARPPDRPFGSVAWRPLRPGPGRGAGGGAEGGRETVRHRTWPPVCGSNSGLASLPV